MPREKQPSPALEALAAWIDDHGAAAAFSLLGDLYADAAVFAVDAQQHVVYWSVGAERLLGHSASDIVGEHCLKANRCEQCMKGCGIRENGSVEDYPLTLYRADGSRLPLRKTARAFFDDSGSFAGGIEVLVPDRAARAVSDSGVDGRDAVVESNVLSLGARPWPSDAVHLQGLVSREPAMHDVFQAIRNVADTDVHALVRGESGCDIALVAQALHAESRRRDGPFVSVSCPALTRALSASELFGHLAGAFVGARDDRAGSIEQASGGTLFLDEISDLSLEVQQQLVRVLDEGRVVPVGGVEPIPVDLRVVAGTRCSLAEHVKRGRFREDLRERLAAVPVVLPPLRERRHDIELLLWQCIELGNSDGARCIRAVDPDAMRLLLDYHWPGNLRELCYVVEYAFAVTRGDTLRIDDLPPDLRASGAVSSRSDTPVGEVERIRNALRATGGHVGRAAALLGLSRPTLWRRRKKLGI
ncbi:MAG: sigma 54-interacting transcriptional regulator [Myxococcales bacterium]|nr:sigma 54-interacting transcriptional regulator [Myxococcales bacterium]